MIDLFSTIDTDGSGAIDADELARALEMMGLQLPMPQVLELIDSVDDDGEIQPFFKPLILANLKKDAAKTN